jgi:hypothetical protein
MEAHFLASLKHPHIITIRAMAIGGPDAYSNGRTDSFFFVMDRVAFTLRDRIGQWRKQLSKFATPALHKIYGEAGVNRVLLLAASRSFAILPVLSLIFTTVASSTVI